MLVTEQFQNENNSDQFASTSTAYNAALNRLIDRPARVRRETVSIRLMTRTGGVGREIEDNLEYILERAFRMLDEAEIDYSVQALIPDVDRDPIRVLDAVFRAPGRDIDDQEGRLELERTVSGIVHLRSMLERIRDEASNDERPRRIEYRLASEMPRYEALRASVTGDWIMQATFDGVAGLEGQPRLCQPGLQDALQLDRLFERLWHKGRETCPVLSTDIETRLQVLHVSQRYLSLVRRRSRDRKVRLAR